MGDRSIAFPFLSIHTYLGKKQMSEVIRREETGVEYFTVQATGESGLSVSGIARLCGFSQQAISLLIENLTSKSPSEWLDSFVGKNLNLTSKYVKKGGEVKIIKAEVAAAIIRHYAIERKLETAILALSMFSDAGITIFIQKMTGWQPKAEIVPSPVKPPAEPTSEEIEKVFAPLYKLGIKEGLIKSAVLTSIAVSIPRLEASAENAKQLISASLPVEEVPVSPTKLGIIFANKKDLDKPPSGLLKAGETGDRRK